MAPEYLDIIREGHTVVCATNRLARHLKHQYARLQIKQGKTAWKTPDILPWPVWLQRCWNEINDNAVPDLVYLGPEQQQYLWQELIENSRYSRQLLQKAATAAQAANAWNIARQWHIPIFPEGTSLNEDAYAFFTWAKEYQKYCRDNGLIDDTHIPDLLIENLSLLPHSNTIALAGFDEFTPLQQKFIKDLQAGGIKICNMPFDQRNKRVGIEGFKDINAEISAAAHWARRIIESGDPGSIGIVVQDLRMLHTRIENTFADILVPATAIAGKNNLPRPYIIAAGTPLKQYPLIQTALNILDLGVKPVLLSRLSSLIRSPFILGAYTESQHRAKFDACLRRYGEYRIPLPGLEYYAGRFLEQASVPTQLLECCRLYEEEFKQADRRQSTHVWAGVFTRLLNQFGWPGDRPLDRNEYQTIAEWYSVLERFAGLDLVASPMTYQQALARLRYLVNITSFQPETPETPIQILGMTGAAAMQFDHLRVLGLNEESWPPQPYPNPFIPIRLQREAGIPEASAGAALSRAAQITENLIGSAYEVVLSYPESEQDRPLRSSPLIRDYPRTGELDGKDCRGYASILFASRLFQYLSDDMAPAIPAGQIVSGGTALFSDQAACPFRACARHRLGAEGLDSRDIGLDARDRGSLMHDVMQRLWGKLKDHACLLSMPEAELDRAVNNSVRSTLASYRKKFPLTFSKSFSLLEAERLGTIIHDWLQIERKRRPFSVSAREFKHHLVLGEIEVRTRIDRIDRLMDGRLVIIDYKTGTPETASWLGGRPDEPQLPLYAVTSDGDIAAVVFARLRRGESEFIGLAEEEDILPGVSTVNTIRGADAIMDWDSLIVAWKDALTALAVDFRRGVAQVDPKHSNTCTWCDLHTLCRIYERDTGYGNRDTIDG